jgi:hypothetical protein
VREMPQQRPAMAFKKAFIFAIIALTLLAACTTQKDIVTKEEIPVRENQPNPAIASPSEQRHIQLANAAIAIIDRNIINCDTVVSLFPWESDTVKITEHRRQFDPGQDWQRKKLITESTHCDPDYCHIFTIDRVINVSRSYYFNSNKLIYLRETMITINSQNETRQLVNDFYFEDEKLLYLFSDGRDMKADTLYSVVRDNFSRLEKQNVLSFYNFASGFPANGEYEFVARIGNHLNPNSLTLLFGEIQPGFGPIGANSI